MSRPTYTAVADRLEAQGFTLGRRRGRTGRYPLLWTDAEGQNRHAWAGSLEEAEQLARRVGACGGGGEQEGE